MWVCCISAAAGVEFIRDPHREVKWYGLNSTGGRQGGVEKKSKDKKIEEGQILKKRKGDRSLTGGLRRRALPLMGFIMVTR